MKKLFAILSIALMSAFAAATASATTGTEFQGCTNIMPLTNRQIASAVEYLTPIIHKYRIPLENIVTHEMVRDEWRISHRGDGTPAKPDIVERDYKRVLESLQKKQ